MLTFKAGVMAFLVFAAGQPSLQSLNGVVVDVWEGDTLTIQTSGGKYFKVRLADVDAPEPAQTFGRQARRFTHDLVFGKSVKVGFSFRDVHRRLIGVVFLPDGRILNEELVRAGYAWHYRVKQPASPMLTRLEHEAFKSRLGLWVETHPLPPWEFRKESKIPSPPGDPSKMDYDLIFSYGIIGDPDSRTFRWPACRKYPGKAGNFRIFGNISDAEGIGYKIAGHCPRE